MSNPSSRQRAGTAYSSYDFTKEQPVIREAFHFNAEFDFAGTSNASPPFIVFHPFVPGMETSKTPEIISIISLSAVLNV